MPPTTVPVVKAGFWTGPTVYGSSALAHLLPFLEQEPLYKQALVWSKQYTPGPNNAPTWGDNNSASSGVFIPSYSCPADPSTSQSSWAMGSYGANYQVFALGSSDGWQGAAALPKSIPDGLSNTILYAERYYGCGVKGGSYWATGNYNVPSMAMFAYSTIGPASLFQTTPSPWETACDPALAQSPHPGGIFMALADGSVRWLAAGLDGGTWWAACTPAGGEVMGHSWD